jgi:hypothetical protein
MTERKWFSKAAPSGPGKCWSTSYFGAMNSMWMSHTSPLASKSKRTTPHVFATAVRKATKTAGIDMVSVEAGLGGRFKGSKLTTSFSVDIQSAVFGYLAAEL